MLDSLTQYNIVSNYWAEWWMVQTLAHTPGREGGGALIYPTQQIMGAIGDNFLAKRKGY